MGKDRNDVIKIKDFKQIGIVTMHVSQKKLLENKMRRMFGKVSEDLIISTVDAFQGQQKDLIIYSLTRTDSLNTPFKSDGRRINVSLSRAKKAMIIVGNMNQFDTNYIFHSLGEYLKTN